MATGAETFKMILSAEDRASSVLGQVGLSLGGIIAAAGGLIALTKQLANTGDELDKMNIKSGFAVEALSALKLSAELNDSSLSDLGLAIAKMQNNLADAVQGMGTAKRSLDELKFSEADLRAGLSNGERFLEQFAVRLFQIPDAGKRTQVVMDLMGRSGTQLLPTLQDLAQRGMKGLREESDRLGVTWTKNMTEASQRLNDNLTRLGISMQGLKLQYIGPLIQSFADLGDKIGLGGPEAQKRMELQSRLSAIEGMRLQLNQQIQVAEEMRNQGVRTGIASDVIFNRMLETGNKLMADRTRIMGELSAEGKKGGVTPTDPAAAATIQKIGAALSVMQQRVAELFKAGAAPGADELERMFVTMREAETLARRAFGITIPEEMQKTFRETERWVRELAKAGGIETREIETKLPQILKDVSQAGSGVEKAWDPVKNVWQLINKTATAATSFSDEMGGWNSRLKEFEIETTKIDLPTTLEQWKKGAEGYGIAINHMTGAQVAFNLQLMDSIRLTATLAQVRSSASSAAVLDETLKRQKLTTNESEY